MALGENGCYDHLSSLPDEIVLLIFDLLTTRELCVVRQLCRRFRNISVEKSLWRHLKARRWRQIDENDIVLDLLPTTISLSLSRTTTLNRPFSVPLPPQPLELLFLDLKHAFISAELLSALLSKCVHLRTLRLFDQALTDQICGYIAQNRKLNSLDLTEATGCTSAGFMAIVQNCEDLEYLYLDYMSPSCSLDDVVDHIPKRTKSLSLSGIRTLTEYNVMWISKICPNLVYLDISDTRAVNVSSIAYIGRNLKNLEELNIVQYGSSHSTFYTSEELSPLSQLPKLRYLQMDRHRVDVTSVKATLPEVLINQASPPPPATFVPPSKARPAGLRFRWVQGGLE